MTDKIILRKLIKQKLATLGGAKRNIYSEQIMRKFIQLPEYINARSIFIYISFDNEVHTNDIIVDAFDKNKRVFVPHIENNIMNLIEIYKDTRYTANEYGIIEPIIDNKEFFQGSIDLTIIPLIGFDRNKSRLGRGGGYYDKFLSINNSKKIAIAYSIQEMDKLPVENHDIKLDMIITEKEIIK